MPNGQVAIKQMRDECTKFASRIDATSVEVGEAKGHPECGAHSCIVKANFANAEGTAMVLRSKAFDYERQLEDIDDRRKVYVGVAVKLASSGLMGLFVAGMVLFGIKSLGGM